MCYILRQQQLEEPDTLYAACSGSAAADTIPEGFGNGLGCRALLLPSSPPPRECACKPFATYSSSPRVHSGAKPGAPGGKGYGNGYGWEKPLEQLLFHRKLWPIVRSHPGPPPGSRPLHPRCRHVIISPAPRPCSHPCSCSYHTVIITVVERAILAWTGPPPRPPQPATAAVGDDPAAPLGVLQISTPCRPHKTPGLVC